MRIQFDSVKRIGRKIGLNEDKGFAVAIFLALIIVSATILGYYVLIRPQAEPYNTIFLLDAQKKAFDYPGTLVANPNATFTVYVNVVDHMGGSRHPNLSGSRKNFSKPFRYTTCQNI